MAWPRLQTLRYSQQNRSRRILSVAFPTLFPLGPADWALPHVRSKPLSFYDWVMHLMRYHDGRFAQHGRFGYAEFDLWMRDITGKRSRWVVVQAPNRPA